MTLTTNQARSFVAAPGSTVDDTRAWGGSLSQLHGVSEVTRPTNNTPTTMASILLATGALLGAGTAARIGLRSMAKNGAVLNPFLAAIAGQKAVGDQWVKGGFQGRMDKKEAVEILGLK